MLKSKRAKSLIPKSAKDCDVSEELTTDVVNFYYTRLRKEMESLKSDRIGVPILGTFVISKPKLKRSLKKLTTILTDGTPESFQKIKKYKLTEGMRDIQQDLMDKIIKDEQEREYLKANVGKPKTNTGRD